MRIKSLIILVLFCFCSPVFSQTNKTPKVQEVEEGDEHIKHGNYLMAIPVYEAELRKDPDNEKLKYKLGVCYLNTRLNRELAVKYLELASKDHHNEPDVWLHLGIAYHLNNRLEDAMLAFEKFKVKKPKHDDEVERYIRNCDNALKLMSKPVKVSFQNLGKDINSADPDYFPYIDRDETFMVFTSRRKENLGGKKVEMDGYRSSDIYQSTMVDGAWTPAKNVGRMVNGNLDEQAVGLRSDGMEMIVYEDHIDKYGDIYVSTRKDAQSEFAKPKLIEEILNEFVESSACFTEDGSVAFFARREDLTDNSDLYMSRKLPNGHWGVPTMLPDNINTPYNEDMPFLAFDGQTLYFASEGHNSMGGYDLFKTVWNQKLNVFSNPENLGYPINSTDDDKSICVTADNRLAYISSFRPNGFGELDIYRVKLNEREPIHVIFTGKVFMGDSIPANQPKSYAVSITVTNVKTKYEYSYAPNTKTGKFVMALPAGDYVVNVEARGYLKLEEKMTVSDMGKVNAERPKNFLLKKSKK
ncbi:MAG: PD40 domain-containing protein [Bacteroidia bacterium]|nr:PD40 domain-containing protein [Bacteroidia bacterium]